MHIIEKIYRRLFKKRHAKKLRHLMELSYQEWQENAVTLTSFSKADFRENDRKVYNMYHNSFEYLEDQGIILKPEEVFAIFPLVALLGAQVFRLPDKIDDFLDFKLISFYAFYNQLMQTCPVATGEYVSPVLVIAHGQVYGNALCREDTVEVETHYQQMPGEGAPRVEFLPVNMPKIRGAIATSPERRQRHQRRFSKATMNPGQIAIYKGVRQLLAPNWSAIVAKQYYDGAIENTLELFLSAYSYGRPHLPADVSTALETEPWQELAEEAKKLPIMLAVAELNEDQLLDEIVFDLTYAGTAD